MLFNQIGKRIYLVGNIDASGDGAANIWEAPRPVLDFQVGKKVIKNKGEIRLNISDILNQHSTSIKMVMVIQASKKQGCLPLYP